MDGPALAAHFAKCIRCRWSATDGSGGVWLMSGEIRFRSYRSETWKRIGRAKTRKRAFAKLKPLARCWRVVFARSPTEERRSVAMEPGPGYYRGYCDNHGVAIGPGEGNGSLAARMARVAAYFFRVRHIEARFSNPRESMFDTPLTLGEVLDAIRDPRAPLSDAERAEALAELTTTSPIRQIEENDGRHV